MRVQVYGRGRQRRLRRWLYGCSGVTGEGMWWDEGPFPGFTTFQRAVLLMQAIEDAGRTGHWIYPLARQIAVSTWGLHER